MSSHTAELVVPSIAIANPSYTWLIVIGAAVLIGLLVVVVALIVLMGGRRRVSPPPHWGAPVAGRSPGVAAYAPPAATDATMIPSQPRGQGWQLSVTNGPDAGRVYPLGVRAQLGRAPGNEVQLSDALASRAHAVLEWRGSGYAVTDLGSANGTLVNGVRLVQPTLLNPGDVIQIGNTQLLLSPGPVPRGRGPAWAAPPPVAASHAVPMPGQGGCLTFKVLLYFVVWFVLFAILAAAVYLFTKEPLAAAGVGLAALLSLVFMVRSLSESWSGQIVVIRTERVYVPGDEDSPGEWEEQVFAYVQQPGRRQLRKIRAMGGWQVGDWLEKRRGETHIRVRGR
jgi:hypothetical protein